MRKLLIVEDDPFHLAMMKQAYKKHWAGQVDIHSKTNQKQFVSSFKRTGLEKFDLVIIDQMLPWTSADDEADDADYPPEGPLRAGTECFKKLQSNANTKTVPVVFFTNLEEATVPNGVKYVRKGDDVEMTELLAAADLLLKDTQQVD